MTAGIAARLGGAVAVQTWPAPEALLARGGPGPLLDQLALALIEASAVHLVFGVRQSDQRLSLSVAEQNIPFVLALGNPREVVLDAAEAWNVDLPSATRAVASSCSSFLRYVAAPGAVVLRADQASSDPSGAVRSIASHFGIELDDVAVETVLRKAGNPARAGADQRWNALPQEARRLIEGALDAYARFFAGEALGEIVWTRELFTLLSDPTKRPTEPIELAGDARCLLYGPYIDLAPGSWKVRVVLGFSDQAAGRIFQFIAYMAHQELASTTLQPNLGGIYVAEINFSIGERDGKGIDLRVLVLSNDTAGQLAFGHVVASPISVNDLRMASDTRESFMSVLDL